MALDPTEYIVAGYASIFGNPDSYDEIVDPGAFAEAIEVKQAIPLYWQHEGMAFLGNAPPRGETYLLREDSQGLYFEANLVATPRSAELATLMDAGLLTDASFAYEQLGWEIDDDGLTHLTKLDPTEVSVTIKGANDRAKAWLQPKPKPKADIRGVFLAELQRFMTEIKTGEQNA